MTDETICETLYKKLNSFVTNVINRDVTPKIDSLRDGKADNYHNQYTYTVLQSSALSNIGTNALDSQSVINSKINEKIGSLNNSPTNTSKEILENDDLNNYTEIGFYYCPYGSVAQTLSNCPVSNAFALFVEKSSGYDNACTQTITTWNGTIMRKFSRYIQTINGSFENSGWKPLYEDTGWKSITNASGFSTYDSTNNPTRYRRIGKIVHIEGIFKNSSAISSGSSAVMGTISDTSCRPQHQQYALMQGSGKNFFLLQVNPNGQIIIGRYGTNANAQTTSGAWLHCYITYFVE